jgi:hypothetical protein
MTHKDDKSFSAISQAMGHGVDIVSPTGDEGDINALVRIQRRGLIQELRAIDEYLKILPPTSPVHVVEFKKRRALISQIRATNRFLGYDESKGLTSSEDSDSS